MANEVIFERVCLETIGDVVRTPPLQWPTATFTTGRSPALTRG
jgi:hypothetical protein